MNNFDDIAPKYRDIHNENLKVTGLSTDFFAEKKIQIIAQDNPQANNLKILDFGCGDGILEIYLNKYLPACSVFGIDPSEKSILEAKNKKLINTSFSEFNGQKIPYPDNTFDIIIVAQVLHHIDKKNHLSVIKEMYRVLKKNGSVYIFEHNPFNPFTRYIVKTCVFDKGVKLLRPKYLSSHINNAGFEKNILNYMSFFPNKYFLKKLIKYENYLKKIPLGAQYYIKSYK